jgi:hypothetical protein
MPAGWEFCGLENFLILKMQPSLAFFYRKKSQNWPNTFVTKWFFAKIVSWAEVRDLWNSCWGQKCTWHLENCGLIYELHTKSVQELLSLVKKSVKQIYSCAEGGERLRLDWPMSLAETGQHSSICHLKAVFSAKALETCPSIYLAAVPLQP